MGERLKYVAILTTAAIALGIANCLIQLMVLYNEYR